jgi:hypothetical protein
MKRFLVIAGLTLGTLAGCSAKVPQPFDGPLKTPNACAPGWCGGKAVSTLVGAGLLSLASLPAYAQDAGGGGIMSALAPLILVLIPALITAIFAILAMKGFKVPDSAAELVKSAAMTAARGYLAKHLRNGSKGDMDRAVENAVIDTAEYLQKQMPDSIKKLGMGAKEVTTLAVGVSQEAAFEVQSRSKGWDE